MTIEDLAKMKEEFERDPKELGYADQGYLETWELFNCRLVPYSDERGEVVGWTSRSQLVLNKDVTVDDVIDARRS